MECSVVKDKKAFNHLSRTQKKNYTQFKKKVFFFREFRSEKNHQHIFIWKKRRQQQLLHTYQLFGQISFGKECSLLGWKIQGKCTTARLIQ